MKTTHTPGPWKNQKTMGGGYAVFATPLSYNVLDHTAPGIDAEANARLIATAPELLKTAAELLRAYDTQYGKLIAGSTAFADAYLALHNAIAKATQP